MEKQFDKKSSLSDYSIIKESPCLKKYLLETTDFEGACIKFILRSNFLPLERRISSLIMMAIALFVTLIQ